MELQEVGAAWLATLPSGVHGSAGFESPCAQLSAGELASVSGAGRWRLREFNAGRWHARRALAGLGFGDVELPRHDGGEPAWPIGVVGSLSHTVQGGRLFAIAAVAQAAVFDGIGVDVESSARIDPRLWSTIFVPAELDALLRLPVPARSLGASFRWSAKEAARKALGIAQDLRDIEVAFDFNSDRFVVSCPNVSENCAGRVCSADGLTFAVALRPAEILRPANG